MDGTLTKINYSAPRQSFGTEQMADSSLPSGPAYSANNRRVTVGPPSCRQPAFKPAVRMSMGTSLVVMLLCSLTLWGAIWVVIASLV